MICSFGMHTLRMTPLTSNIRIRIEMKNLIYHVEYSTFRITVGVIQLNSR